MIDIEKADRLSWHNRTAIETAAVCSCYFCLRTFPTSEIHVWIDRGQTAVCPHCDIDAVLVGEICKDTLAKLNERWFTGTPKIGL